MKKLQDLFPNMDKVTYKWCTKFLFLILFEADKSHYSCQQQANTADMLDLAVVYIKDLQKEVQVTSNFCLIQAYKTHR